MTNSHATEDFNLQHHCCEILKSFIVECVNVCFSTSHTAYLVLTY